MRASVSILERKAICGGGDREWVSRPGRARPTLAAMSEEDQPSETAQRDRLIYWIRRGMAREDMTQADFARAIGAPPSTVSRWLGDDYKAVPDMTWLGPICRALRVDPMLFAKLPPIPSDPLEQWVLADVTDLLTVSDATRLARLDQGPVDQDDPPAGAGPSERPRRRLPQGGPRCPRGPRDQ